MRTYKAGDIVSVTLRIRVTGETTRLSLSYRDPAYDRTGGPNGPPERPGQCIAFDLAPAHAESDGTTTFTGTVPRYVIGATYVATVFADGPGGRDVKELGPEHNIIVHNDPPPPPPNPPRITIL